MPTGRRAPRFVPIERLSGWRRIAVGMWDRPTASTVYGEQRLDARAALALVAELRARHPGARPTVAHVFVKAVGDLLRAMPDANVMLRRGRFFRREDAAVFMQVAIPDVDDLGGIKISHVDRKSLLDLAVEVEARAARVRDHSDPALERAKRSVQGAPPWLMGGLVRLADVLSHDLGLDLSSLGAAPDAFGGAMVTNIGSFGLPHGYAPLVPASRVPMVFCVGAVRDEPVVDEGQVVARPTLTVCGTFDHRVFDGLQLARISRHVRHRFEDVGWLREERR